MWHPYSVSVSLQVLPSLGISRKSVYSAFQNMSDSYTFFQSLNKTPLTTSVDKHVNWVGTVNDKRKCHHKQQKLSCFQASSTIAKSSLPPHPAPKIFSLMAIWNLTEKIHYFWALCCRSVLTRIYKSNLSNWVAQTLCFTEHKCFVCNNYTEVYMKCIISIVTTNVYSITSHPHVCCLTVHNDWSQDYTGIGFYLVCLTLQISLRTQKQVRHCNYRSPSGSSEVHNQVSLHVSDTASKKWNCY